MDLDDHWRQMRRRKLAPTPDKARAFRSAITLRVELVHPHWRDLSNPELAKVMNAMRLKTFEARSWDAGSVRTFRLALETENRRVETKARDEVETERERIIAIQNFALRCIREPADDDAIQLGLLWVEDRNQTIPGLAEAMMLVAKRDEAT